MYGGKSCTDGRREHCGLALPCSAPESLPTIYCPVFTGLVFSLVWPVKTRSSGTLAAKLHQLRPNTSLIFQ